MDERTKRLLGVAALVGMFATATARAIDVRGADDSASDAEAAVRAASQAYVEALARGDAEAIAAMWTADGVYVDAAGQEFVARELAHREFDRGEAAEKHPLAKPAAVKSTIRLLDDNVALEEGTADTEELAGGGQPAVQFSAVWVREGNDWRLDHLREHVVEATPKKSPLDELSWFVGNWVAHGADVDAELSVRWSDDRHFLLQRFTVRRAGHNAIGAEQRIGWDPADEVIRSWSFHSDGGFSEGQWSRHDDAWVVATAGVLPNGHHTSATSFWVPEGEDVCWFKLHRGSVDDAEAAALTLKFERIKN